MSEETMFKISIATIASVGVAVLSIVVMVLSVWTGSISTDVKSHATDIATLKQCVIQMVESDKTMKEETSAIKSIVTDIRLDQAKHYGVSLNNNKLIKTKSIP